MLKSKSSTKKSSSVKLPKIIGSKGIRSKASKMIVNAISNYAVLSTTAAKGLSKSALLTSSAQMHTCIINLIGPLKYMMSVCGQGPRSTMLAAMLIEYASRNAKALHILRTMSTTKQVLEIGAKGNVIGAIVEAALAELISIFYYCWGTLTFDLLMYQTKTHAVSCVGAVSGGTIGAAAGCCILPGIGTAIGSFIGSYLGTFIPSYIRGDGWSHQINEDCYNPSRKVKAIEVGESSSAADDWLEVVDCSTKSYFNFCQDNGSECEEMLIVEDKENNKRKIHIKVVCESECSSVQCLRTNLIEDVYDSNKGYILISIEET